MQKQAVVEPRCVLSNEVDRLQEKIRDIRQHCRHDFRLFGGVELPKSRVANVYVIHCQESFGQTHDYRVPEVHLHCLLCSETQRLDMKKTCPRCLGAMRQGEYRGAGSREEYFGQKHLYYAARTYHCTQCVFVGVADEWDQ